LRPVKRTDEHELSSRQAAFAAFCRACAGVSLAMPRVVMKSFLFVAVAAMVALSACSGNNSSSDSSSLANLIVPTLSTETFSGTVAVGGTDSHPFTVTTGGTINVTLTAASPPSTIFMGIGVGTPSTDTTGTTTCTLLSGASTVAPASTTAQLSGTIGAGSYCVAVYDVGNETTPVTYTVTVSHT